MIELGNTSSKVIYDLKTRGKLVIKLTNGKYVTFTKQEIGTSLWMKERWSGEITNEPYKTKIKNAAGNAYVSNITEIIDRGNFITYVANLDQMTNLRAVKFDGLKTIEGWTFAYDSNLKRIEFPSITKISINSFFECHKLEYISLPSLVNLNQCYNFASCCTVLSKINLPSVEKIYGDCSGLFSYSPKLKKLDFPKLKSINPVYFGFSEYIEEMNMPKLTEMSIGVTALSHMSRMKIARFLSLDMDYVKSKNAWGLPKGCKIICKNNSEYIQD